MLFRCPWGASKYPCSGYVLVSILIFAEKNLSVLPSSVCHSSRPRPLHKYSPIHNVILFRYPTEEVFSIIWNAFAIWNGKWFAICKWLKYLWQIKKSRYLPFLQRKFILRLARQSRHRFALCFLDFQFLKWQKCQHKREHLIQFHSLREQTIVFEQLWISIIVALIDKIWPNSPESGGMRVHFIPVQCLRPKRQQQTAKKSRDTYFNFITTLTDIFLSTPR